MLCPFLRRERQAKVERRSAVAVTIPPSAIPTARASQIHALLRPRDPVQYPTLQTAQSPPTEPNLNLPRHRPKHVVENLVCQIHRLLDRPPRRHHADVHLSLPRQPNPGNQTRAQVNQRAVQPRHPRVRVEHASTSVGARESREISRPAGSAAAGRTKDTGPQSTCPASSPREQERSPRTPCSAPCSHKSGIRQVEHKTSIGEYKAKAIHRKSTAALPTSPAP